MTRMIAPIASVKKMDQSFEIDGIYIKPSPPIRNLGVLFDQTLSFGSHISSLVRVTNYLLLFVQKLCS